MKVNARILLTSVCLIELVRSQTTPVACNPDVKDCHDLRWDTWSGLIFGLSAFIRAAFAPFMQWLIYKTVHKLDLWVEIVSWSIAGINFIFFLPVGIYWAKYRAANVETM